MFVIDPRLRNPHPAAVITHDQILAELRAQVGAKRFTQKALADHLRIAPARVKEMLNGDRRVQQDEMPVLAEWLGMSDDDPVPAGARGVREVPLLGKVPGGNWREAVRRSSNTVEVPAADAPRDAYALEVEGNSMNLVVPDGFTIVVDPNDVDLFAKRLYVVMNPDGEVTFKQYMENPARLVPCSTEDKHKDIPISGGGFRVVGRITWSGRRH